MGTQVRELGFAEALYSCAELAPPRLMADPDFCGDSPSWVECGPGVVPCVFRLPPGESAGNADRNPNPGRRKHCEFPISGDKGAVDVIARLWQGCLREGDAALAGGAYPSEVINDTPPLAGGFTDDVRYPRSFRS